ncbi:unnamed protein product [Spirodela intermedia]|uniref:SAP domain-containing protein n=1 Tax=Spirodela intermedia TaxID=51605 RepID=A0A7I8J4R7_SPIIN|nr:unnamed protein product [Spirodela intermedia]CAA6665081.1 unnamed protein product [Spirodela intermedia]
MPTGYSILDNRPLDHWKVTELKEELRRRKLTTKGLKEDLVKRLDEAVRNERALLRGQELVSHFDLQPKPQDNHGVLDPHPVENVQIEKNTVETVLHFGSNRSENQVVMVDINADIQDSDFGMEFHHEKPVGTVDLDEKTEEKVACGTETADSITEKELNVSKSEANGADYRDETENMYSETSVKDAKLDTAVQENQVSEVSLDLGLQVKCDSISTDSVSLNEKIVLKDDLNANNFHLEEELVKTEVVQSSSSHVAPVGGDLQPLNVDQEPDDNKVSFEEEDDITDTTNEDHSKKIGGSPEKLNLDRSSGDESMEEDVLDTKQIEANNNSDEVGDVQEVRDLHVVKEETPADAVPGGFSPDKKDVVSEGEMRPVVSTEKRKLEDQGSLGTAEPIKRQRRWNSESIKIPNRNLLTRPLWLLLPRRHFSRHLDVLPPSQKTATNSLRIDRFLRPFTLKAVQELLAKTGTVSSFWMDHIKTHCYVTYSSVEEAVATRNAVYNLQWPPNGGRLLVADFVDPQEVKSHVEAPQSPAPTTPGAATTAVPSPMAVERPPALPLPNRQQQAPAVSPVNPPPPPEASQTPPAREQLPPPPPLSQKKQQDQPILTLDDLFKKTRASPRIYYLPLSEEQVAAKVAASQGRSTGALV